MNNNSRNDYYDEYEIDLREYIILLWNHKLFIGAVVILAVAAAFIVSSFLLSPTYETKARIQLSNYDGLYSEPAAAVQLLSSTSLMKKVMSDLDIEMSAAKLNTHINNNLNISQIANTAIISITVNSNQAQLSLDIAEGLIDNFKNDSKQYFQDKLEKEKEYISDLKNDLSEINSDLKKNQNLIQASREKGDLKTISLLVQENSSLLSIRKELRQEIEEKESKLLNFYSLKVLGDPYLPEDPISPNTRLNIAIAAVLGLMLAVFIIFFKEFMKED